MKLIKECFAAVLIFLVWIGYDIIQHPFRSAVVAVALGFLLGALTF